MPDDTSGSPTSSSPPGESHQTHSNPDEKATNTATGDPLANVEPVKYDNPWDFVPDQPNNLSNKAPSLVAANKLINCDSSSGVSSTSSGNSNNAMVDWSAINGKKSVPDSFETSWSNNDEDDKSEFWDSRILDDPFDAEWAALATRNNAKNNTNPFTSDVFVSNSSTSSGDDNNVSPAPAEVVDGFKAEFELQM